MVVLGAILAAIAIMLFVVRKVQRSARQSEDAFESHRKRQHERRSRAPTDQPIDPDFIFDDPPDAPR